MHDPRTRLVADGYDLMGERFAEWRARIRGDPRLWWAEQLTSRLEDGARVLDLGCGAGVPDTQLLAERFRVTGVDISPEQIKKARANVPHAVFMEADFTALIFDPGSFDAVAAFYSFNHVPRELLAGLFGRIRSGWSQPAFSWSHSEPATPRAGLVTSSVRRRSSRASRRRPTAGCSTRQALSDCWTTSSRFRNPRVR